MSTITGIPISEEAYNDIARQAEKLGVSPEEWAANVLSEHIRLPRLTDEFFDRRAQIPSSLTLQEILDKAPNRPPDPGDEIEA